jgi:hypothetical protein
MSMMRMDPAAEMRVMYWMDSEGLVVDCRPLSEEQRKFRHEMAQRWGRWWNSWPWEEDLWASLKTKDAERNLVDERGWQG